MAPSMDSDVYSNDAVVVFARDDIAQPYAHDEVSYLTKRRGIGGGGRVSGGFGSSGGRSSTGSSSSSSSSSSSRSSASKGFAPGSVSGGRSVYGSSAGTGIPGRYGITSGAFAGRSAGGGTRSNVYGSSQYGSGYPSGYATRGALAGGAVGGLGFPFIFWPIAFGGAYSGYYGSRELDENSDNRPGGEMTQYTLTPPSSVENTTANQFALYGDANSVDAVWQAVKERCQVGSSLASNFSINPNQAVQYYRGSSFALLLDGYNNTQPLNVTGDQSGNATQFQSPPDAPPITSVQGVDTSYFTCLNQTTGDNVPLLENSAMSSVLAASSNNMAIVLPVVLMAMLLNLFA